ncbi:hypothetical protein DL95DRAFT_391577, partial [Leptodontidium sp. 2 PMI_412]
MAKTPSKTPISSSSPSRDSHPPQPSTGTMPLLSPSRDELTPLLPRHAQPHPEAKTWWGRNWRPIRFFCVIVFVCWFVVPWIWGILWWVLDGGV